MRRTYIIPAMVVVRMQTAQMMAVSGVTSPDRGIGFGGIAGEDDGIIPSVKTASSNIWDDEW